MDPNTSSADKQTVRIWDAPTRLFHWITAVSVILLLMTGFLFMYRGLLLIDGKEPKAMLQVFHVLIGYVFVFSLAGRLIWGFFGNATVRWKSQLRFRDALRRSGLQLKSAAGHSDPGRQPTTQVIAAVFFVVLTVQALTGLVRAATDVYYPPFGGMFAARVAMPGVDPAEINWKTAEALTDPAKRKQFSALKSVSGRVHYYGSYVMLALVLLHLGGVVWSELRERSGIVSGMISGYRGPAGQNAQERTSAELSRLEG